MAEVYVGLGTNLGDKEQNLRDAVQKIEEQIGKVVSLSAFYVTAPWGFASENSFLNAAACVDTDLSPLEVLRETQLIERELGRTKKSVDGVYSDRLIDIDLLLYDDLVLSVTSPSGAALNLCTAPIRTVRRIIPAIRAVWMSAIAGAIIFTWRR